MGSPSSSAKPSGKSKVEKFFLRVILPAIVGKTCAICLSKINVRGAAVLTVCFHAYCLECIRKWSDSERRCPLCNSAFDSWFYKIDPFTRKFLKQQLPALSKGKPVSPRLRSTLIDHRRLFRNIESIRQEMNSVNRRTKPLPWQRSFGRPRTVPPHVIAKKRLQWRASVYHQRLQAVPISHGISSRQNVPRNDFEREKILQRIEPWIRRELEAILGDPDPSIILHVVTSLLFYDGASTSSGQLGVVKDNFLAPLECFLHDRTSMFWHELRCFVDSSLTMEKYDEVVEYRQLE